MADAIAEKKSKLAKYFVYIKKIAIKKNGYTELAEEIEEEMKSEGADTAGELISDIKTEEINYAKKYQGWLVASSDVSEGENYLDTTKS